MKISIVIPVYNERENIEPLRGELDTVLAKTGAAWEVLWVNDGSTDGSSEPLANIAANDQRHKLINFARNFGQTAALSAGIAHATGSIVIPMDADLQNDPADIPRFLEKLDEGYDVVSGWRKDRQDGFFLRRVPSRIANALIGRVTGVRIHDYGCTMKAYRRELLQEVQLYGEMHRFIPAYIGWGGGRVGELVVHHRPRTSGTTKYGIGRTFRVLLDLLLVTFLSSYMSRPIHFFGGIGFLSLFLAVLVLAVAVYLKIFEAVSLIQTPLPILSAMLVIVGIQLILMGVIAEMLMRVYYESQAKTPYVIRQTVNL